jgi:hypothetical protein
MEATAAGATYDAATTLEFLSSADPNTVVRGMSSWLRLQISHKLRAQPLDASFDAAAIASAILMAMQTHSMHVEVQCSGCSALAETLYTYTAVEQRAVLPAGEMALALVLAAMHNHDADAGVHEHAMAVLAVFAFENFSGAGHMSAIEAIIESLRQHTDISTAQKIGMAALCNLLYELPNDYPLDAVGVEEVICAALSACTLDAAVHDLCCQALMALWRADKHNAAPISAEATMFVLQAMRALPARAMRQYFGCQAISVAAARSSVVAGQLADQGAVDAMFAAMAAHPTHAFVQDWGMVALSNLTVTHVERFFDADSTAAARIDVLVAALCNHCAVPGVVRNTLQVLHIFFKDSASNCAALAACVGGVNAVVAGLDAHWQDDAVAVYGCSVLRTLALSGSATLCAAMVEAGAVEAVARTLSTPSVRADVAEAGYTMLHALMQGDDTCQLRALDAGVLRINSHTQTPKRGAVERLLRQRAKKPRPKTAAEELAAVARADHAAAALLAEEAAAKEAAKTKRKPKKKTQRGAAGGAAADATAEDASSSAQPAAEDADSSNAGDAPQPVVEHNTPRTSGSSTVDARASGSDDTAVFDAAGDELEAPSPLPDSEADDAADSLSAAAARRRRKAAAKAARNAESVAANQSSLRPTTRASDDTPQRSGDRGAASGCLDPPGAGVIAANPYDAAQQSSADAPIVKGDASSSVQARRERKQQAPPLAAGASAAPAAHADELPLLALSEKQADAAIHAPAAAVDVVAALAPPVMPLPLAHDMQQQQIAMMMPPWLLPSSPEQDAQDAPHTLPSPMALPRRAPPPYRPPSGAPPAASTSDAAATPSIFVAVDALVAAQLAQTAEPGHVANALVDSAREHNRLLNTVVHALFHVHCFSQQLTQWPLPALHDAAAPLQPNATLVIALRELFLALRAGWTLRDDANDDAAAHAATPTALRLALAALSGAAGGGDADTHAVADAPGVVTQVYLALQALNNGAVGRLLSISVLEQARCTPCRKVSHTRRSSAFFHVVPVAALCAAHASAPPGSSRTFEALLARLRAGFKPCDKAAGGCGAPAPVVHVLKRAPNLFTLVLLWDAANASEAAVAAAMAALGTALRPELFYFGGEKRDADAARMYDLRALVCGSGSRCASFARTDEPVAFGLPSTPAWTRFDAAGATAVGGWADVCDACARGRLQPSVLFYEHTATCF